MLHCFIVLHLVLFSVFSTHRAVLPLAQTCGLVSQQPSKCALTQPDIYLNVIFKAWQLNRKLLIRCPGLQSGATILWLAIKTNTLADTWGTSINPHALKEGLPVCCWKVIELLLCIFCIHFVCALQQSHHPGEDVRPCMDSVRTFFRSGERARPSHGSLLHCCPADERVSRRIGFAWECYQWFRSSSRPKQGQVPVIHWLPDAVGLHQTSQLQVNES